MKIKQVKCQTALSPSRLPGLDYSLNPYRGCQHCCAYCYVPNVLKISRDSWGDFVDVKINIPSVLSKELKKKKPGVVGISTVTDPYQPIEKRYRLTRYCLEQLVQYDFPVSIQTKSSLVIRDIDIVSRFSDAEVMISIGTLKEDEKKLLEPNSSPINERLNVLKEYSKIGVKTSVFFGPIYPTIAIDELSEIIDTFLDCNVSEVMIDCLNLKPGIWTNIEKILYEKKEIYNMFLKNLYENEGYYNQVRTEVMKMGKEKNLKIVDAF